MVMAVQDRPVQKLNTSAPPMHEYFLTAKHFQHTVNTGPFASRDLDLLGLSGHQAR
jgi:hypothetical protein